MGWSSTEIPGFSMSLRVAAPTNTCLRSTERSGGDDDETTHKTTPTDPHVPGHGRRGYECCRTGCSRCCRKIRAHRAAGKHARVGRSQDIEKDQQLAEHGP